MGKKPKHISPKKTRRWLTNKWKDAQCWSLLEKCKSKLQWDITLYWSEWSSSKSIRSDQISCSVVSDFCDPMNRSTPGLPVHHQLPEFTQTHVHWVGDAIQPSHPLSSPSTPAFNLSQHQGFSQWVSSSHQVAKVLEFQLQHQSFQWIIRTDFL